MIVLGAGDEQDAVAESGPGFGFRAAMVGKHDDADFGFAGGFQNFGASALGVVGILGVDVEDGAVILIDAGRRRRVSANLHPFDTLRMDGFEMSGFETLNGSAGEEESGEKKKGEEPHTFILREADAPLGCIGRRVQEPIDTIVNMLDVRAVLLLGAVHVLHLAGQVLMRHQILA